MVHALEEIERVLTRGGKLVDLRPVAAGWPLEIYIAGKPVIVGQLDASAKAPDDIAADQALEAVVSTKLFDRESGISFEYEYYWESLEQMMDFFEENWSSNTKMPGDVLEEATRLAESSDFDEKIRVRRNMIIGSYRTRRSS